MRIFVAGSAVSRKLIVEASAQAGGIENPGNSLAQQREKCFPTIGRRCRDEILIKWLSGRLTTRQIKQKDCQTY